MSTAIKDRHHKKAQGHRFSLSVWEGEKLVGVAVVGRPVSRGTDHTTVLEVTRLCTDGTKNACSKLYSAAARVGREMGYQKIQTYILEAEPGTSLLAAGWRYVLLTRGGSWSCQSRKRIDKAPTTSKKCYERKLR